MIDDVNVIITTDEDGTQITEVFVHFAHGEILTITGANVKLKLENGNDC